MTSPEEAIVLLITTPPEAAHSLAEEIVRSRLAACANVLPSVTSIYWWEGGLQWDEEALLLVKTLRTHFDALAELVRELHPYDTPEIIALPLTAGSPAYLSWVADSVAPPAAADRPASREAED